MIFSIAAMALAAVAVASPAEMEARARDPPFGPCKVHGSVYAKVVCCNRALPLVGHLLCKVLTIENTCAPDQKIYCCKTTTNSGLVHASLRKCALFW